MRYKTLGIIIKDEPSIKSKHLRIFSKIFIYKSDEILKKN